MDSVDALRQRFEEDGYLLIRKMQPANLVEIARQHLINQLSIQGQIDTVILVSPY